MFRPAQKASVCTLSILVLKYGEPIVRFPDSADSLMMWDTCTFHFFISSGGSLVIIRMRNPNILSCQPGICRMSGIPADCRSGTRPRHSRTKPEPQCEHCSPLAVILDAAGHRARSRAALEQTVFCC